MFAAHWKIQNTTLNLLYVYVAKKHPEKSAI